MNPRLFLVSLLSLSFFVHLLRFPHLILENGGGAFFILYFICLHVVAFPVLLAERVLNTTFHQQNFDQFIILKKQNTLLHLFNRSSYYLMNTLRVFFLVTLFLFFLYIGGVSFLYVHFFADFVLGFTQNVTDVVSMPSMQMSMTGAMALSSLCFLVLMFFEKKFVSLSCRYFLPICYAVLIFLFIKVIVSVTDYEGFKILLYPDFSELKLQSLLLAIGHSLMSLLVGLGMYNYRFFYSSPIDHVHLFIKSLAQVLLLSLFIGVMALPMIEEVSETPFGSNWIFEILPRWLAYGEFGYYYCFLFFVALAYMSFYVSLTLLSRLNEMVSRYFNKRSSVLVQGAFVFIGLVSTSLFLYFSQSHIMGWSGQSLLLKYDFILVNLVLPIIALFILILVFQFSTKKERELIFSQQKVFFHNQVFFTIWQNTAIYLTPFLIVLAFIFYLLTL